MTLADVDRRFGTDDNIGVLLGSASGGLVDVDLDCDETVALAQEFLPETALWSGRTKRPRSHAWYCISSPIKTTRFRDGTETLLEIRSDGSQTLIPPSVHPSGDRYVWGDQSAAMPAIVDASQLDRAVRDLALAALVALHWPGQAGTRHDTANALAGYMVRNGVQDDSVPRIVEAASRLAGDTESRDRGKTASSTVRRVRAGRSVTGGRTLRSLIGPGFVERCASILGRPVEVDDHPPLSSFNSFSSYPDRSESQWPAPLDPALSRGVLGELVDLVAPHTEADPAAIAFQLLAAIGSRIGRHPYYRVEADRHFLNLYVVLVGASSRGRKGTSWSRVRDAVGRGEERWATDRVGNGLSSGEGLIWAVRDAITKTEPIREKKRISGYQEVVVDPGVRDKRLLVVEPEFASTLKVMAREGNTLSPVIRSAWDDGQLRILTKNSPARATNAHISIIGHITKDELTRSLDSTEMANGFANRFLWVCVRRARCLPDGGNLDPALLAPIAAKIDSAIRRAGSLDQIHRSPECTERWHEVYPELSRELPGLFGSIVSRAEAQVTRLSTLLAVLDEADAVQVEHLEAALDFWRYGEDSARFIFGDQTGDPVADRILDELRRVPEGLTRTEISNLLGRNKRSNRIKPVLALLARSRLARSVREPSDGRPVERWFASHPYERNEFNEESPHRNAAPTYERNELSTTVESRDGCDGPETRSESAESPSSSKPNWMERRI